jgi:hypothetical protein
MARNARNEGVAEKVIMDIGGWKTAAVFKRYSIVNPNDSAMAIRKVEARRQRDLAAVATVETSETQFSRVRAENGRNCTRAAANCQFHGAQPKSSRPA